MSDFPNGGGYHRNACEIFPSNVLHSAHGDGYTHGRSAAAHVGDNDGFADGRESAFYRRLNQLLREHRFDDFAESQRANFYAATTGRPSLPPAI